jgi:hypothetical protein
MRCGYSVEFFNRFLPHHRKRLASPLMVEKKKFRLFWNWSFDGLSFLKCSSGAALPFSFFNPYLASVRL